MDSNPTPSMPVMGTDIFYEYKPDIPTLKGDQHIKLLM